MDSEQKEMQFLGFLGIYKEACKTIFTKRKIFTQITLALILPLALLLLAHIQVSETLSAKITQNQIAQYQAQALAPEDENRPNPNPFSSTAILWVVNGVYLTLMLIYSLLSVSAIIYSVACIYTSRDISFKKVMSIVPKVWKRLMVTFSCVFLAFLVYFVVGGIIIGVVMVFLIGFTNFSFKFSIGVSTVLVLLFTVGSIYMTMIWYLANAVTVLEEARGVSAMTKSKELLRGKTRTVFIVILVLQLLGYAVYDSFRRMVLHGESLPMAIRVVFGILCFLLLVQLMLFGLVVQTIVYFVCKSYHNESIDKSALSDRLEVYHEQYVPLKTKDVELEQSYV